MLESCFRPLERCFGCGGDDELMWDTELKPHASGDFSMAVVQANSSLEDQGQVLTTPSATYVGVFDGHGGPEASRFITNALFSFLNKFVLEEGGLSPDVIRKAYTATEDEFLQLVKQSWLTRPQMASVGSCCLVGAIAKDTLYVANLGDSRAVLGRRASSTNKVVVAERMSTDHNVGDEDVRKEVEALHPDDSQIVAYIRGVWRIKGIIQVSRSIGDFYLKKPEFHVVPLLQLKKERPLVTAEPSILTRKLKPNVDLFLIFASDGLWEHLSDQEAVDIVHKNPRAGIAKRLVKAALQEAARKREIRYEDIKTIKKGSRRYFHDDITVVVVYLDHHQDSRRSNHKSKHQNRFECTAAPVDIFSLNTEGEATPLKQYFP